MIVKDIILNPSLIGNEDFIFAKKENGKFSENSEVAILFLTDEEKDMLTDEIAKTKCPGFEYFLEAYMIKEIINDLNNANRAVTLKEQIDIIIHYVEFDS